jgi:hypothetical protein
LPNPRDPLVEVVHVTRPTTAPAVTESSRLGAMSCARSHWPCRPPNGGAACRVAAKAA